MTTKKPFTIGERVKVYGYDSRDNFFDGEKANVSDLSDEMDRIKIKPGTRAERSAVHVNQLRRLKPKKPKREFWIRRCLGTFSHSNWFDEPISDHGCKDCEIIHVREVREKKK